MTSIKKKNRILEEKVSDIIYYINKSREREVLLGDLVKKLTQENKGLKAENAKVQEEVEFNELKISFW
ncbi:MAG: hypothetical protein ABI045_00860 [Flavobacteriales bacterium]